MGRLDLPDPVTSTRCVSVEYLYEVADQQRLGNEMIDALEEMGALERQLADARLEEKLGDAAVRLATLQLMVERQRQVIDILFRAVEDDAAEQEAADLLDDID